MVLPLKEWKKTRFRKMALARPTQMTGHAEKAAFEMFGHLSVTIIKATFPP